MKAIVAKTSNQVIAVNHQLPYYIPDDLKWFQYHTIKQCVIMGHRTWLSLGNKPLKNRIHIVITHSPSSVLVIRGEVILFMTFKNYMSRCFNHQHWVIGGQQIYELFIPYIDTFYITECPAYPIHNMDHYTFFQVDLSAFKKVAFIPRESHEFQIWSRQY